MTTRQSKNRLSFWLIFITLFTIIPLLLIEATGRLYIYAKHGKAGKSYGLWQYDRELGAVFAENGYNTNAETNDFGYRNTESVLNPKPDGALRVIAYGGSTTFCYNLLNHEAWPALLEGHLRKNHNPNDQVLNGGVITWSIGQLYAKAKRDLPILKSEYVLLYTGVNEHQNRDFAALEGKNIEELVKKGQYGVVATNLDQSSWAKRNLVTLRLLEYTLLPILNKRAADNRDNIAEQMKGSSESVPTQPDPSVLANYQQVLRNFVTLIRENGGKPIFIIEAHSEQVPANFYLTSYSRTSADLAKELGVPVFDGQDVVKAYAGNKANLFIASGAHFEKQGAELFADFVYKNVFAQKDSTQLTFGGF